MSTTNVKLPDCLKMLIAVMWSLPIASFVAMLSVLVLAGMLGKGHLDHFLWLGTLVQVLMWVSVAWILVFSAIIVFRFRRICRDAKVRGGRICLKCLYDLSTSPRDGKCPECGEKYTHEDLLEYWGVRNSE
ncbi:MAG: hypothetical protein EA380_02090 [Phycisphaeraceae bacterium]|nr:MAG: hypothetical protein EA380_02090 [Phycisphaeraceae bacterium]